MYKTLNTVKQFIEDNIQDAIDTVQLANSIVLTPYKVLQIFSPSGRQFPAIAVLPYESEPKEASAGNRSFFGNPNHRDEILSIFVWDRGNPDQANTVEANVVGYSDALEELFNSNYLLEGIKGIDLLGTSYTELIPDISLPEAKLLLKGATIQIKVRFNII